MMANLNFDAYRFSISWSRIFPSNYQTIPFESILYQNQSLVSTLYLHFVEGTGKVNKQGVAYYNRLIDYMLHKGTINFFTKNE